MIERVSQRRRRRLVLVPRAMGADKMKLCRDCKHRGWFLGFYWVQGKGSIMAIILKQMKRAVFALGLMLFASVAYAVPTLRLSVDGGAAITCADGQACDAFPGAGLVILNNPGGVFSTLTVSAGKLAFPGSGSLDSSTRFVLNSGGIHTLQLTVSEVDYFNSNDNFLFTIDAIAQGSVAASAFFDPDNVLFAEDILIGSINTSAPANGHDFVRNFYATNLAVAPYSLTMVIDMILTGTGGGNLNAYTRYQVPEPATFALLGLCLAGLAFCRNRRAT